MVKILNFMELFPAMRYNLSLQKLFSMPQKELPLVALFCQKKIAFGASRIFTTIGASFVNTKKGKIKNRKLES
jgi:hypothetical protein